jgi:hypothetical protein
MMRTTSRLQPDQAWRKVRQKRQQLLSAQLTAQHGLTSIVYAMNLENVLRQIDADCPNLHSGTPLLVMSGR